MVRSIGRPPLKFYVGFVFGVVVTAYGWVGQADYDQAVADNQLYCQMVEQHLWRKQSNRQCPKPQLAPTERLVSM